MRRDDVAAVEFAGVVERESVCSVQFSRFLAHGGGDLRMSIENVAVVVIVVVVVVGDSRRTLRMLLRRRSLQPTTSPSTPCLSIVRTSTTWVSSICNRAYTEASALRQMAFNNAIPSPPPHTHTHAHTLHWHVYSTVLTQRSTSAVQDGGAARASKLSTLDGVRWVGMGGCVCVCVCVCVYLDGGERDPIPPSIPGHCHPDLDPQSTASLYPPMIHG
jgi:hypothetical protein